MNFFTHKLPVVLAIAGCVLGQTTRATVHVVQADNFFYSPASLTIDLGDTVRFIRVAGTHPTESSTGAWTTFTLNSSLTSYDLVLSSAGFYPYLCTLHEPLGMIGDITVQATSLPCGPTSPPTGLGAAPGTTSAIVSWNALPNTVIYQVQGRPLGASSFRKKTTSSTSVNIPGLMPGTTYEWQVRALCAGTEDITIWSPLSTFSTMTLRTPAVNYRWFQQADQLVWQWSDANTQDGLMYLTDMLGRMVAGPVQCPEGEVSGLLPVSGLRDGQYFLIFHSDAADKVEPVYVSATN